MQKGRTSHCRPKSFFTVLVSYRGIDPVNFTYGWALMVSKKMEHPHWPIWSGRDLCPFWPCICSTIILEILWPKSFQTLSSHYIGSTKFLKKIWTLMPNHKFYMGGAHDPRENEHAYRLIRKGISSDSLRPFWPCICSTFILKIVWPKSFRTMPSHYIESPKILNFCANQEASYVSKIKTLYVLQEYCT